MASNSTTSKSINRKVMQAKQKREDCATFGWKQKRRRLRASDRKWPMELVRRHLSRPTGAGPACCCCAATIALVNALVGSLLGRASGLETRERRADSPATIDGFRLEAIVRGELVASSREPAAAAAASPNSSSSPSWSSGDSSRAPQRPGMAELNPDASDTVPVYMQHMTVVLVTLHLSVFITGLVGNSLVCLSVYRNKSLQTITNYYIVNLAVADFLVILICLPPTVYWDLTLTWNFGPLLCKLVLYLQSTSVSVSVLTLTCISIDRWYAICKPLNFCSTKSRAKLTIALIWLVSMLIASPDVIYLTTRPLYEENDYVYMDCTYSWPEHNTKMYQLCIVVLLFVLPFVLMTISYAQIVNVLWRNETMAESMQNAMNKNEAVHLTQMAAALASAEAAAASASSTAAAASAAAVAAAAAASSALKMPPQEEVEPSSRRVNKQQSIMSSTKASRHLAHHATNNSSNNNNNGANYNNNINASAKSNGAGGSSNNNTTNWQQRQSTPAAPSDRRVTAAEERSTHRAAPVLARALAAACPSAWCRQRHPASSRAVRDERAGGLFQRWRAAISAHYFGRLKNSASVAAAAKRDRCCSARQTVNNKLEVSNYHEHEAFGWCSTIVARHLGNCAAPGPGAPSADVSHFAPAPARAARTIRWKSSERLLAASNEGRQRAESWSRAPLLASSSAASSHAELERERERQKVARRRDERLKVASAASLGGAASWPSPSSGAPAAHQTADGREKSIVAPSSRPSSDKLIAGSDGSTQSVFSATRLADDQTRAAAPDARQGRRPSAPTRGSGSGCSHCRPCCSAAAASTDRRHRRRRRNNCAAGEQERARHKSTRRLEAPTKRAANESQTNGPPAVPMKNDPNETACDGGERATITAATAARMRHHQRRPLVAAAAAAASHQKRHLRRHHEHPLKCNNRQAIDIDHGRALNNDNYRPLAHHSHRANAWPSGAQLQVEAELRLGAAKKGAILVPLQRDFDQAQLTKAAASAASKTTNAPKWKRQLLTADWGANTNKSGPPIRRTGARVTLGTDCARQDELALAAGSDGGESCEARFAPNGAAAAATAERQVEKRAASLSLDRGGSFWLAGRLVRSSARLIEKRFSLVVVGRGQTSVVDQKKTTTTTTTTAATKKKKTKQVCAPDVHAAAGDSARGVIFATVGAGQLQDELLETGLAASTGSKSFHGARLSERQRLELQPAERPKQKASSLFRLANGRAAAVRVPSPLRPGSSRSTSTSNNSLASHEEPDATDKSSQSERAAAAAARAPSSNEPSAMEASLKRPAGASSSANSSSMNTRFYRLIESRKKAAKMLIVIVIMFGLCYLPVHFLNTLRVTIGLPQNDITTIASLVSHWLCYFNSAVNPLIYNLMSGKFRHEFANLFFCRWLRRATTQTNSLNTMT